MKNTKFRGNFDLKPGTILKGYTEGSVEARNERVVIASEPGGKNALEGDRTSMLSLADAIRDACGVEAANAAPDNAPAPSIIGANVVGDTIEVSLNNGKTVYLRKPVPVRFQYVA